ncbi:hypothetical protein [Escherichia phage vB_EcoM-ZQ3]|uniref:Uncharacterized protein n=1 Tax=Escherichia phage vB_EcoM-ZQ3 TaxID=2810369 RepID=A0A8F3C839_9CAUD|nr:hypothetical protein [Escherichia phage vB_EcoM-ZQ3]
MTATIKMPTPIEAGTNVHRLLKTKNLVKISWPMIVTAAKIANPIIETANTGINVFQK